MELLQAVQYFFIAPSIDSPICDTIINQVLTIAGFLHICLQPYFCHVINASLTKNEKYIDRYMVIKRLCLMGGMMLFGRFLLAYQWPQTLVGPSTEWLRGSKLCTYRGNYHLAWSVPMADPTYVIPGAAIHSFLMFAPFFALYEKERHDYSRYFSLRIRTLLGRSDYTESYGTSIDLVLFFPLHKLLSCYFASEKH